MSIKPTYEVRLVGRASADAVVEKMPDGRPVTKFRIWVGSGKNKKTDKYQEPFFFNCKCFGDQAQHIKKDSDVELFGYVTRREYINKKNQPATFDEVVVKTNEKREPMLNYAGMEYGGTKGVSDEAVASGQAPTIQRKQTPEEALGITDDDYPAPF